MSLKKLFSQDNLEKLRTLFLDPSLDEESLGWRQREILEACFPGFSYDSFSVSLIEASDPNNMESIEGLLIGFPAPAEEVSASYALASHFDHLSMITYANLGRMFLSTDVFEDPMEQQEIFKAHCCKFNIYRDAAISFNLLASQEYYIAFDYIAQKGNEKWRSIDPTGLEYASFIFALGWLCRWRRIGKKAFEQHLKALSGMTFSRLTKLRRFINRSPGEELATQATSLGLKLKGYDDALYKLRDVILDRFGYDLHRPQGNGPIKLEAIEPYCFLLTIMNDATQPIVLPNGVKLTEEYGKRQS